MTDYYGEIAEVVEILKSIFKHAGLDYGVIPLPFLHAEFSILHEIRLPFIPLRLILLKGPGDLKIYKVSGLTDHYKCYPLRSDLMMPAKKPKATLRYAKI